MVADLRHTAQKLEDVANILQNFFDINKRHPEKIRTEDEPKAYPVKDKQHSVKCNLCGKTDKNVCDLERHIKKDHRDHENFECEKCKKIFVINWRLEKHVKMHLETHLK